MSEKLYQMTYASVYQALVNKVERKATLAIRWQK